MDETNSSSVNRFVKFFPAILFVCLGLSSILLFSIFNKASKPPIPAQVDISPSIQDSSRNLPDQVSGSQNLQTLEDVSSRKTNILCDETLDSDSEETRDGFSLIHLTNDMLLSVEKRTDGRLFVGAYGKESSNFSEYEMELPVYLYVSGGWDKRRYDDGIYGVWEGCYPHACPDQRGAAIFDCHTQRFYTIHFVKASARNDREEERNTLNGESLPDEVNYVNFPLGKPPSNLLSAVWESLSLEKADMLDGRLCSSLYCDGGGESPSNRNQSPLIGQVARSLAFYGLTKGMPYSQARRILMQRDWQPEVIENASGQFPDFPEVSCGNAICATSLRKDNQKLNVFLNHDLEVSSIGEEMLQ